MISTMEQDLLALPERMRGGIQRYLDHGIPPGHFMTAVISNDLREACARADDENRTLLFEYIKFFYCHAPAGSWGSEENFKAWVKRHSDIRAAQRKEVADGTASD